MHKKAGDKKIYRAAIIGCGRIGCGFDDNPKSKRIATHAGAYSNFRQTELMALSDLDVEKLRRYGEKYHVKGVYQNYEEMLEKEAIDILSVCTYNSTHLEIIENAINYNIKAILCEKPIADTLANAVKIVNLCRDKNIILSVNHLRRFDPSHQEVKNLIEKGVLGDIQQTTFYYTAGIANTGSHVFDLLRFFFGDVEWVQAIYSNSKFPNPNDPNIDGILKFKKGFICSLQSCDVSKFLIFELDIIGMKGRLKIMSGGYSCEFYEPNDSQYFPGYKELAKTKAPINETQNFTDKLTMINIVVHLVDCLDNNKTLISTGDDGKAALELICAVHESARRNGAKINLPLAHSDVEIKSK
ncbi:MAG: Gfo/Idh/MocA family oxidoreductase [Planctomycetes bacterium]|nr:Gfo/Idh/MocA family oxidoreductase [Planctomycetota bacterium]